MAASAHCRVYCMNSYASSSSFRAHSSPTQLLSVVSLLSAERPNTDSPANVDAAKEVRENFEGTSWPYNPRPEYY